MDVQNSLKGNANFDRMQQMAQTKGMDRTNTLRSIIEESAQAAQMNQKQKKIESEAELNRVVEQLNKQLSPLSTSIQFGVHKKSDVFQVSVVETDTKKILRTFPSEEAIGLMMKMKEVLGIIFDEKG